MDLATQMNIENCIINRMCIGKMFTAYDITLDVRHTGIKGRHKDFRDVIHQSALSLLSPYSYDRTFVQLHGKSVKAWVYHKINTNPNDYGLDNQPTVAITTAAAAPSPTVVYALLDGRETLCIRAHIVRDAGLYPGDKVIAIHLNDVNRISLSKLSKPITNAIASYTVDKYSNIRVTRSTLRELGPIKSNGNGYQISVSGKNSIEIS